VSSYPRTQISIGSPIGAALIKVTLVPGINPMSSSRSRSAPSPATARMVPVCPIFNSSSVMFRASPVSARTAERDRFFPYARRFIYSVG